MLNVRMCVAMQATFSLHVQLSFLKVMQQKFVLKRIKK